MAERVCPVDGCAVEIPRTMLACRRHWSQVPVSLRRHVHAAYRAFTSAPTPETCAELEAAQAAAIHAVEVARG